MGRFISVRREWLWALSAALLLSSAALGWMAWERGELELYLILIFPVLKAEGAYGAGCLLLAFVAAIVALSSFWTLAPREGQKTETRTSSGGVVLIGPLPIVWGSDRRTALLAVVIALIVVIMVLLLVQ